MNVTENESLDEDISSDNELEDEDFDLKINFSKKELSLKKNIREEIEKKLELLELKKLGGDSIYDELF